MYNKSQQWVKEATRCLVRAVILKRYFPNDYSGAIEALQHSFELACKSWYLLVGVEYPRNHNPANNIDEVSKRIHASYPVIDDEFLEGFIQWMKDNSVYLGKLHEIVMYGDEKRNVPASEFFTKEEVSDLTIKISAFWSFTYIQLTYIGQYFGYLTEEKYREFLQFAGLIETYKDIGTSLSEEETKKLFSFLF